MTSITPLGVPNDLTNCTGAVPPLGGDPCESTCEFNNIEFGKGGAERDVILIPDTDLPHSATIRPQPAGHTVEFKVTAPEQTAASIQIYDLSGVLVNSMSLILSQGENSITLDVSTLQSGTYYYSISSQDRTIVRDKLIITH